MWDTLGVPEQRFDLERIQRELAEATRPGGKFSQRSLDNAAKVTRGTVGEIIRGKNRNPTTQVLSALAQALGGDLSMFGLVEERATPPTEAELEIALLDALPNMPKRGTTDKRAQYLAQSVARLLKLPQARPRVASGSSSIEGVEAAPPRGPTTTA